MKKHKDKYVLAQKQSMAAHRTAIPALPYTAFSLPACSDDILGILSK
jgi:hypothetical protein